jgi:hypothetical protein
MNNANMPAMPIGEQIDTCHLNAPCNGLTKREHFAGLAMEGMIVVDADNHLDEGTIAKIAVNLADALLAELDKVKS